ncbi:hypothetical protein PVAND_000348 [Polypedilum vanderplanki]|uniref:Uncharacterized protein n=1 Tax=Polypedilum vanderplanki TaxID=319348 RepID=A0A9J6BL15_POLVA|nr:hypothetical protein PVAND_000348 [Polypedilum vanderplanki]
MFPDHSRNHIEGPVDIDALVNYIEKNAPINLPPLFNRTLWYNKFRWNATQYFLDLEPADAMTIGNHEFDHGIEGLVPFLERIKSPVISCNIDTTHEPEFGNFSINQ